MAVQAAAGEGRQNEVWIGDWYADEVLAGRMPVGKLERLACERYRRDLETGHERGLKFSPGHAQHALDFIERYCRHSKGEWAGQPLILDPWEIFIVANLFGWLRADGLRRFRIAYNELPRKNGKTTLAGAVGLYLLAGDGEPGAEVYSAATKRDQAKICLNAAKAFVRGSSALSRRYGIQANRITGLRDESFFQALGGDGDNLDGLNPHGSVIDELHAHKNRKVWDVIRTAFGARRQWMLFTITTAGWDRNSLCYEQHDYAVRVLEGKVEDDSFFAFIAAADEDDDWTDPATWEKANPNYNVSVYPEALAEACKQAEHMPALQNAFRRLYLCQWTEQADRYLDIRIWDKNAGAVDPDALIGRRCFGGLDLSITWDMSACVWLFPPTEDDPLWRVLPRFWIPRDNMRIRIDRDRVPMDVWVREGLVRATDGDEIDYDVILADILADAERFDIEQMAFDRYGATHIVNRLTDAELPVVKFNQGILSMSPPTKHLPTLLKRGELAHGGNRVLRWHASNMAVKVDENENMKPDKKRSTERIDGMVALIMALGLAMGDEGPETSVYEDRGVRTL